MHSARPLALALMLAALTLLSAAPGARAQTATCPATFHVLHDDRIGQLELPEGLYRITTDGFSCEQAAHLFAEFLPDFNGVLPAPYRYEVLAVGSGRFVGARGRAFTVRRTGDSGSPATPGSMTQGGGSHGDLRCPSTFRVLNDDRIGALRLPRGDYRITLLGTTLTCTTAVRRLRVFLRRPDGRLPGGWVVLPLQAEFVRGSTSYGFRLKRV